MPRSLSILHFAFVLAIVGSETISIAIAQRNTCNAIEWAGESSKILCVCNEIYCGDLRLDLPEKKLQTYVYETTKSGKRLEMKDLAEFSSNKEQTMGFEADVIVNMTEKYQTIFGWGGAFTDSTGFNVKSLPEGLQTKLIEAYFGPYGLQYNYGRVPIAGTDFSMRNYTYDDLNKPDYELRYWSLAKEDHDYKIPLIKEAIELTKGRGADLKLFASPWSPPAWLKDNKKLVRGHLVDDDQSYKTYAEYLMKFYDAYKKHGINFWGATVQNEPVASNLPFYFFNSLQLDNDATIKLITKYLGPALEARGYTKENFKLMIGDDSLGFIHRQVESVLENEDVRKYVSGLAFHWYTSGPIVSYSKLDELYDKIKDKIDFMMMSEACEGSMPLDSKVKPGSWSRAESYASDIIEDLNRNTNAWIDWNMVLDMNGGPNWSGNNVDSPILVDANKQTFYKQPMYYSLAHFSRFIKPGSVRINSKHSKGMFSKSINTLATYNAKSHHLTLNILNKSRHKKRIQINIVGVSDHPEGIKLNEFVVDRKSITTVIMKL